MLHLWRFVRDKAGKQILEELSVRLTAENVVPLSVTVDSGDYLSGGEGKWKTISLCFFSPVPG